MGVVLGMMLATVLLVGVGERFNRPYPVLVLIVGVVLALMPGIPRLHIDPSLILPLFLPPLIFAGAQRTSWRKLWELRRSVFALSLVLVLVTIAAVALVARAVVADVSVAAAIALGALAAPPDPVAAEAVAGPIGLPRRLITLLQAEGLCNDATALVVYGLAVQYITGRHLAAWEVVPKFFYEAAVGSALGVAIAWISGRLRGLISDATARSGLTLIVPFVCYLVASAIDASGVLAVLAAALFLGRSGDDDAGVVDRLSGGAFWDTLDMLITGVAFGLIGLELREVLDTGVDVAGTVLPALAICAVIVGVRVVWMLAGGPLVRHSPLQRTETAHSSREDLVLAWCGMRGRQWARLSLLNKERSRRSALWPRYREGGGNGTRREGPSATIKPSRRWGTRHPWKICSTRGPASRPWFGRGCGWRCRRWRWPGPSRGRRPGRRGSWPRRGRP